MLGGSACRPLAALFDVADVTVVQVVLVPQVLSAVMDAL